MKDYFKYEVIKRYFDDFVVENSEELQCSSFRDDLHHHAFNTDYFIIGTQQAKDFFFADQFSDHVFDVINIVKDYEQDNFGEVTTDLSCPESVVNMYAYIVGEEIVSEWLEANKLGEEVEE